MFLSTLLENTLMAGGLAAIVAVVCRFNRARPALCHMLWLLVFAVLVTPPLPVGFGGTGIRTPVSSLLSPTPEASSPAYVAPAWGGKLKGADWDAEESGSVSLDLGLPEGELAFATLVETPSAPSLDSSLGLSEWFTGVSTRTWLLGFWLAGSVAILVFMHRRISRFHRGVKDAGPAPTELVGEVQAVAKRLGMRAPEVRLLEGVGSPSVWCFGRARLLWPTTNGAMDSSDLAPSLIAHELAHIARRDTWVSRLEVLAIAACWWHPLFWLVRRQVHAYAELSCDAWALWAYPKQRLVFAEALIGAHEDTLTAPVALQGLCATNSDFKDFERRLEMILSEKVSRSVSKGAAALAIASTVLLLPGQTQDSDSWDGKKYEAECEACEAGKEHNCIDQKVEIKKALGQAEKIFQSGDMPSALDAFEAVLKLDQNQANAHARLAYIQIGLNMTDEARVHLQHAIDHRDNVQIAAYNLACCDALEGKAESGLSYLAKSIRNGFADEKLLASDTDLDGLRKLKAFSAASSLVEISNKLRADLDSKEKRSPEDTASLLRSLSRIVSEDGETVQKYAMAAHNLGDYKASLEAFGRQAKLGHNTPTAMYNRGCALAMLGDNSAAMTSLFEAADLGMAYPAVTEDADLTSLHSHKKWGSLVERLSAAKKKMKKVASVIENGDLEQANAILAELAENEHVDAESRGWASLKEAELLMELGRHKQALASFNRAAAEDYAVDEAAFGMAAAYAALGKIEEAEGKLHAAVELGFSDYERLEAMAEFAELESIHELAERAHKQAEYGSKKKKKGKLKSKELSVAAEAEQRYFDLANGGAEEAANFTEHYLRAIEEAAHVAERHEVSEGHIAKLHASEEAHVAKEAAARVAKEAKFAHGAERERMLHAKENVHQEKIDAKLDAEVRAQLEKRRTEMEKLEVQLEIKRVELEKLERELKEKAHKEHKKAS